MSVSSDQAEDVIAEEQVLSASEDDDEEEPAAIAVEAVAADDGLSEQEDEEAQEVMEAVVVDEDEEDGDAEVVEEADVEEAVAVPVAAPPKKKIKVKKKENGGTGASTAATTTKKKKKVKKKRSQDETMHFARISSGRLSAAESAREMLIQTVPRLPVKINETHTVRNFGQLHIEGTGEPAQFATGNALYPVGFSCDRFEFSPVHGRVLKMRCSIIDGIQVKKRQAQLGYPSSANIPNGPIFRVMWGQGIDEDVDMVDYPYDPYSNSAPLTSSDKVDAVAIPAAPGGSAGSAVPEKGMRVKVRFEQDQFYYGHITHVTEKEQEKGKKKKKRSAEITIRYDDGSTETAIFPDPDITLVMPGKHLDREIFALFEVFVPFSDSFPF